MEYTWEIQTSTFTEIQLFYMGRCMWVLFCRTQTNDDYPVKKILLNTTVGINKVL